MKIQWNSIFKTIAFIAVVMGIYYIYTENEDKFAINIAKDQIIEEQNIKYEKLKLEHQKSQALIKATTEEVRRLSVELNELKGITKQNVLVFNENSTELGLALVSDYIKQNESFSSVAYMDADNKYRNGYGTLAKLVTYKIGDIVKVKNIKGKTITLTATSKNQKLPERNISEKEALRRKETHLTKEVFPYLYGKQFRSKEEFIVATDVIYNRGIGHCKNLFNSDGTINCKSVYDYMHHSKEAYRKAIIVRYAKSYALCIQSQ